MRYGTGYLNPGYEVKNKRAFWWCVTGRAISTLATKLKIRASILVVRYGTGYLNPGYEVKNKGEHFGGALRDGLSQPWLRS
ncbi:MAG: hypothetical protein F6K51_04940 [Moorea sp. SIO3I8]|nr:hypothetical protein [Moorena sp. SIO3I8]